MLKDPVLMNMLQEVLYYLQFVWERCKIFWNMGYESLFLHSFYGMVLFCLAFQVESDP